MSRGLAIELKSRFNRDATLSLGCVHGEDIFMQTEIVTQDIVQLGPLARVRSSFGGGRHEELHGVLCGILKHGLNHPQEEFEQSPEEIRDFVGLSVRDDDNERDFVTFYMADQKPALIGIQTYKVVTEDRAMQAGLTGPVVWLNAADVGLELFEKLRDELKSIAANQNIPLKSYSLSMSALGPQPWMPKAGIS